MICFTNILTILTAVYGATGGSINELSITSERICRLRKKPSMNHKTRQRVELSVT